MLNEIQDALAKNLMQLDAAERTFPTLFSLQQVTTFLPTDLVFLTALIDEIKKLAQKGE